MIAHINIGSNIGNRAELINRAVSLLGQRIGSVEALSHSVESAPWGYESEKDFMNIGVNVLTDLDAHAIISQLKEIEKAIDPDGQHRNADGEYVDRAIDLDLICLGNTVVDAKNIRVPHPRMHLREFVLIPLSEILPEWVHPEFGMTAEKLLEHIYNKTSAASV